MILEGLYKEQEMNKAKIYCSCHKVPMTITYFNGLYAIDSAIGHQSQHDKRCYYSASTKYKSVFEQGWEMQIRQGKTVYIPKMNNCYFGKKKYDRALFKEIPAPYLIDSQRFLTFRGFCIKLNLIAWESFVKTYNRLPNNLELMQHLHYVSELFYPKQKSLSTLQTFLLEPGNQIKKIPEKSKRFIYGEILSIRKIKSERNYYIDDYIITINYGLRMEHLQLRVEGTDMLLTAKHNLFKIGNHRRFVICAIVNVKHQKLEVETLEIFPVTNNGLYYETDMERKIYTGLENKDILFIKPHLCVPEHNFEVPMAILIEEDPILILNDNKIISKSLFLK